jgi:adenosylcobinamide-phosphate synthase
MLIYSTAAILIGFLLDLLVGDPQGWPHVVRFFGRLIAWFEKLFYPLKNKRAGGALLVVCVLTVAAGLPFALVRLSWKLSPWAYLCLESVLIWQLLAVKSLRMESDLVYRALKSDDLPGARKAVSHIVGRDTAALDEPGVARAAVETVAENASDGVIAPMLYILLGGGVLGCFYKAVNTMDSMIGYRNERYLDFGRTAARLDDAVNYIPSRLAALIMIAASGVCGLDAKHAARIWKRDRRNHKSPNSAQTESVAAGALSIRLAGDARYFGKLIEKPTIGDDIRPVEAEDIRRMHRMLYAAAWIMLLLILLFRGVMLFANI